MTQLSNKCFLLKMCMKLVFTIFTLFLSSRNKFFRKNPPPSHISPLSPLTGILAHISSLGKMWACELIFKFLRYLILIVMWIQPIFSFTEFVTCSLKAFMFWQTVAFWKGILKNLAKFTGKHLCRSLFLNKVAGLNPAFLLKRRHWHRRFSVNFVKLWFEF